MKKNVSLPLQYVEKLEKEAEESGCSASEIIRRALDYYFARRK